MYQVSIIVMEEMKVGEMQLVCIYLCLFLYKHTKAHVCVLVKPTHEWDIFDITWSRGEAEAEC